MFLKTDGAGNLSFSSSLPTSSVGITQLSATGSPSSSTFLRGDNSWASAGAIAGQVIQVVSATDSTLRSTTSTSYVTGSNTLSVTITPSSASNKILILASVTVGNGNAYDVFLTVYRGGSNLVGANGFAYQSGGGTSVNYNANAINYLDSPATTSATTYQVYFKANSGIANINVSSAMSVITVLEIKG